MRCKVVQSIKGLHSKFFTFFLNLVTLTIQLKKVDFGFKNNDKYFYQIKYAFNTYCCIIRWVLKNDPFRAMACRMILMNCCLSL